MKLPRFNRNTGIIIVLAACIVVAFILRILPLFSMDAGIYRLLSDPDVWYNFRQIEVMVNNFPQYNWFDAFTAYPEGKNISWGPLFPAIPALLSLLGGAVLRADSIAVSSWVPVFFGVLMVVVVFSLVRVLAGWKAGIIAAVFIAVVSGEYFYRTMAGLVDHHCTEIFFTTLFCLFYIYIGRKASGHEIELRNPGSLKILLIPSIFAGLSISAGLAVIPTTLLFAMIVAAYTFIQYTWNIFHGKSTDYLFVVNAVVSACAIVVLLLIGVQSPEYSLTTYSAAPIHAFILLFCGTALLQVLSLVTRGKPWVFIGLITLVVLVGVGVSAFVNPAFLTSVIHATSSFFGQSYSQYPIEELEPWSVGEMWASYNIAIILAFIGFVVLAYQFWKKECPAYLFVLVWGVVVLISTIQHSRFEYYTAVVVVTSAAIALNYAFNFDETGKKRKSKTKSPDVQKGKKEKKKGKGTQPGKKDRDILPQLQGTGTSFVLACALIFCGISVVSDYSIAINEDYLIPAQWTGVLEWMSEATPDPGVPYLGPYEDGWTYPIESYGVLSWWDYGHWITFISKRIPVTNPFQDNVRPSSAYFFAESEGAANQLADLLGAKYVVTDWKMVGSKFPGMIGWYDIALSDDYYYQKFLSPGERGNVTTITLLQAPYYQTMVSRLHNFDGSFTEPEEVVYVEYSLPQSRSGMPSITRYQVLDYDEARELLAQFESGPHEGMGAGIVNTAFNSPVEPVDALQHYRLIYEQAEYDTETGSPDGPSVKVFEYVRGAVVNGEGEIQVTIETNIGRTFTYRQKSVNGTFVLPYATKNPEYPVSTEGPYRLLPSGMTVEVTEQDVRYGSTVAL